MIANSIKVGIDIGVPEKRRTIEALEELLEEIHGPIQVRIAKCEATRSVVQNP